LATEGTKITEKKQRLNAKKIITCLVKLLTKVLLDSFVLYVHFVAELLFVGLSLTT